MCGIAGVLDTRRALSAQELADLAGRMATTLRHRGPDDEGRWADPAGGIGLGHRRLAVVDLSAHGHQPMHSTDGRWVACYNGEIYNFPALRKRLEAEGSAFQGGSDTEVLLAAIQQWGLGAALDACEGMFALALWDRRERELHLVRDRFGEKPLYHGWVGGLFAFGSELKAFHALPGFVGAVDRASVGAFLRFSYVPAPLTIYRGVEKLLPGHRLTIGPGTRPGATPSSTCYWSASDEIQRLRLDPFPGGDQAVVDEVETTLRRAVGQRMLADVPVGAFLSGGVDSSLIVAFMQQHSRQPVRTFTIGLADQAFDESSEASAVARHLGTDHTPLLVSERDAAGVIPMLADIWDEPFSDISQIPTFLVSRLARTAVTVALSGDGGDELFAGYNRHAWLERLWRRGRRLPQPLRQLLGRSLRSLPPSVVNASAGISGHLPMKWQFRIPATKVEKVGRVLGAGDPDDAYLALASHWQEPSRLVIGLDGDPGWGVGRGPALPDMTEEILRLDLLGYLPDDILTKVDRAAMATSLETRVPFLDREVFELAWRLPMTARLNGSTTKWALRQVLYRHVPRQLIDRPKMGFDVPIGKWLRGDLRPWAEDLLNEDRLHAQGVLRAGPIREAWQQHLSGRRDLSYELWDVLVLQAWMDRWGPTIAD